MPANLKKLPKSEVELTVSVPYAEWLKAEKWALAELSSKMPFEGFRPGHVPEAMIRERAGVQLLQSATLEHVLPPTYAAAVKEHSLPVVAAPRVDVKAMVEKEGDTLVYTARVAVMPEVKLGDYKKIKVARKKAEVTPKEVQDTLQMIADRFAEWNEVPLGRVAQKGDRAELTFEGFNEKGEPLKGTASKNHPVILGSGVMIPGFEEAVEGMKAGETKTFTVTFPKDYRAEDLKGKKATFKVTLEKLEERTKKELDAGDIKRWTGREMTPDDFKKDVEAQLLSEVTARLNREHDQKVIEEILKITKTDVPEALILEELEAMKADQKARIESQGLTWEQYLAHLKKTDAEFAKDHQKTAEERIRGRLGVQHIMKEAKIEVSPEEVEVKVAEIIAALPQEDRKRATEWYKRGTEAWVSLKNNLAADKLINMLSE